MREIWEGEPAFLVLWRGFGAAKSWLARERIGKVVGWENTKIAHPHFWGRGAGCASVFDSVRGTWVFGVKNARA
jgi:hypothetical protein